MAASADSIRVSSPEHGQGEIVSSTHKWFSVIRWADGKLQVIDKPNLCALIEAQS